MNYSEQFAASIKKCTSLVFGSSSIVFMYGYEAGEEGTPESIGLLVEYDIEIDCLLDKKIDLISVIGQELKIYKVDVLTNRKGNQDHRPVVQEAYRTGKLL